MIVKRHGNAKSTGTTVCYGQSEFDVPQNTIKKNKKIKKVLWDVKMINCDRGGNHGGGIFWGLLTIPTIKHLSQALVLIQTFFFFFLVVLFCLCHCKNKKHIF